MNLAIDRIEDWLGDARRIGPAADGPIGSISTDTRTIGPGALYVALRGERFDGHDFIDQALAAGACGLVLDHPPATEPAVPTWIVADTLVALGRLAAGWRRQHSLPVVAVLGSNGKTTVKEMITAILRAALGEAAVLSTPGNFNNAVGLPLTLFGLRAEHRVAVLELGTNHPGEIAQLAPIAAPQVVVITNAQREHQEFLEGVLGSARENGSAIASLPSDGVAVYPGDDDCAPVWDVASGARRRIRFGLGEAALGLELQAPYDSRPEGFVATAFGTPITLRLAIAGRHNVRNALAAAAAALALNIRPDFIAAGLAAFRPVNGRLCWLHGRAGARVIDDTYNANPDSVRAAIEVLAGEPAPRVLVLGAMAEVGERGPAFHAEIGRFARECGINHLLALGEACEPAVLAYGDRAVLAKDLRALLRALEPLAVAGSTVLVKGSRGMRMERVLAEICDEAPSAGGH
ncbi:MAG: UDP-N-acetylmuramoyl-tripeptide--D-alanyl-D-alanine ligase [Burkholderiaceae bacterium]